MLLATMLLQAAVAAPGAPSSAPPATAPAQTMQARFDAATQAVDEGRCADAVAQFDALEKAPGIQRNALALQTLRLRRARCLIGTARNTEAEQAIAAALPVMQQRAGEFADEIAEARRLLVFAARQRGDYDSAIRQNEAALAQATGADRLSILLALADLTMFDHDGRALRYAEEARTLAQAPGTSQRTVASVQTVYGRVLLNEGRKAEAYAILKDSLAKQGAMTFKVTVGDLETRSDLAVAAMANGDRDAAQRYLVFTGAGRLKNPLSVPAQMDFPQCGTDGLKPQDFAIIGLSLAADGHVEGVAPIYVGGNRATALAFAQAVRGWSWRPEVAAAIPPLFRALTRVEVRCTNAVGERLSLDRMALDAVPDWAPDQLHSGTAWEGLGDAEALPRERAALAAVGTDRKRRLRLLIDLLENRVLAKDDRKAFVAEARQLADVLGAPSLLRLYLAAKQPDPTDIDVFLRDPAFMADPLTAAMARVAAASPAWQRKVRPDAAALLDAAIAQPGLPDRHPIKVRALLLKANMLSARGDVPGARAALAQTGLTSEQCSIAGVEPMMKSSGANYNDYPDAALQMGFEGWVRTEFDIASNGRTLTPRTLAAYPPFIFGTAANDVVRGARFSSTFQPDAPVACTANTMNVSFKLPQ